jgi:hypothetical protein
MAEVRGDITEEQADRLLEDLHEQEIRDRLRQP